MSNNIKQPFYLTDNLGFAEAKPEDDFLHPQKNAAVSDDSLTETQFFGFSVPEAQIHAIGYTWQHPNLRVVSGGLLVFKGFKRYQVAAELSDVRMFMSDATLRETYANYRLANGYGVEILEPLRRYRMTYRDEKINNAVDLTFEAVQPPVMYADGLHFEQPVRVRGELLLRGERHTVNCYHVRDRSWGRPRSEASQPIPPVSWMSGVFNDDFSFNLNALDHVDTNPELAGRFEFPPETSRHGWVIRDGQKGYVVDAKKRLVRDPLTLLPSEIELALNDHLGRTIRLHGQLLAACPWEVWPNMLFMVCSARWECEGMVTYGDFQEGIFGDYAAEILPKDLIGPNTRR